MARKPQPNTEAVLSAVLDLAAERGWRAVSLADVADRAAIPLTDLVEQFPTKGALLTAYAQRIDQRMLAGGSEPGETTRDRLFEVLMRRFEAMAPDRRGLKAIAVGLGDDPAAVLCGGRRFLRSMALALETAGLSAAGLSGLVRVNGVAAVVLYTLRTFLDDDSGDLSRTMAHLDRALRRAETIAGWMRRPCCSPTPSAAMHNGH